MKYILIFLLALTPQLLLANASDSIATVQRGNGKYVGQVNSQDLGSGQGTFYFDNGDRYEGAWKNGEFDGLGTLHYANGDRYEGQWKNDKKNGRGIFYYTLGDRYDGEWKDDFMEQGTFYYKDGNRYEGHWLANRMDGEGTFYFSNGSRYEGKWKNGMMHGPGTLFDKDGNISFTGNWRDNKPVME